MYIYICISKYICICMCIYKSAEARASGRADAQHNPQTFQPLQIQGRVILPLPLPLPRHN